MITTSGWFAIGALSAQTGCKVETIRFYEQARLLPTSARSPGGYRLYSKDHLKRLTFIRRARALRFSIDEVPSSSPMSASDRVPRSGSWPARTWKMSRPRSRISGRWSGSSGKPSPDARTAGGPTAR